MNNQEDEISPSCLLASHKNNEEDEIVNLQLGHTKKVGVNQIQNWTIQ
jgi:hypothetical protein